METLIAASIFTIIATIATTVFVRTIQAQTRTEILNAIYEDGRVIMEQLTNEIQNGAIDYEEYYNVNVTVQAQSGSGAQYGINYGVYGSRFYDPGWTFAADPMMGAKGRSPYNLGVECSYPYKVAPPNICELYYSDSKDLDTGQNPYAGKTLTSQPADANALCSNTTGNSCPTNGSTYQDGSQIRSDELYIISEGAEGTHKTIFAQMLLNNNDSNTTKTSRDCSLPTETNLDCGIGKLKMVGNDTNNNGIVDTFACMPNYDCSHDTGTGAFVNDHLAEFNFVGSRSFVPITPFRTSIKSIKFIISPPEDPYKAFAEPAMQVHPYVTILMEIEPSFAERNRYRAYEIGTLKLQRTVTAGITRNVNSYPPQNDVSWICGKTPGDDCAPPTQ